MTGAQDRGRTPSRACPNEGVGPGNAASLQERLRAHADLLGVYTDTEAVVADLREAADEFERLMANQRTGRIVHGDA